MRLEGLVIPIRFDTGLLLSGVGMIKDALGGIVAFGKDAVMAASRVQELGNIVAVLGKNAGYTTTEIDANVKAIQDMGISMNVSRTVAANFIRSNLDLADASKLARVAQDAATLSAEDSSTALDGLIDGIMTQNTEVLRTHGIYLDVNQAMKDYAKQLGVTKEQLTVEQRQQAVLNGVIEAGVSIQGAYEASMKDAGKQMRSLTGREFPDMLALMGTPLLNGFSGIITGAREWVKAISKSAEVGGEFEPVLQRIGGLFDKLVESIFGSVDIEVALTHIQDAIADVVTGLEKALDWGIKFAGEDFAGKIQMIADGISGFSLTDVTQKFKDWVASVNWESLSQDFAAGMNRVDWGGVTRNVLNSTVNILQALLDIIDRTDWSAIDTAMYNALVGVLRDGIGRALTEAWTGAAVQFWKMVDSLLGTSYGTVSQAWASGYNAVQGGSGVNGGTYYGGGGTQFGAGFYASGGNASGLSWVGERGPELLNLPGGSHVYSNQQSQAMSQIDYERMGRSVAQHLVPALQAAGFG